MDKAFLDERKREENSDQKSQCVLSGRFLLSKVFSLMPYPLKNQMVKLYYTYYSLLFRVLFSASFAKASIM